MVIAVAMLALPAQAAGVRGLGTWETTLQGRDLDGNAATAEAFYDTALKITWLADANNAHTSGYTSATNGGIEPWSGSDANFKWTDGRMGWGAAQAWASGLNVNGVTGWRLPTLVDQGPPGCDSFGEAIDCGYGVDTGTSEFLHLFHVTLGNRAPFDAAGNYNRDWGLSNTGPFSNVQRYAYWTGVEVGPGAEDEAWLVDFELGGGQGDTHKAWSAFAWAVHDGDVGGGPVLGDRGSSPLEPVLPRFVDGTVGSSVVFEFDDISVIAGGLGAPDGPPIWIDPEVAVGYRFDVSGNNFQSVTLPLLGDLDGYLLQVWLSGAWVDVATLMDGGSFTFDPGVSIFRIMGINPTLALDPANPNAFVTGINFGQTGVASVTMTPITMSVPEPGSWALALAGGLVLARVRRRK